MINQTVISLLLWVTISLVVGTLAGMSNLSEIYEQKIEQRLKHLNKPAVRSIHSPDGDIIDCVWIYHQPAFDHLLLENHTIQMRTKSGSIRDKTGGNKTDIIHQLWRTKGECPENTIPIRRRTRDDLLRSDSIENYGRKSPSIISPTTYHLHGDQTAVHEHACVYVDYGEFHGSKSRISIWKPNVPNTSEFSLAQTWVVNGDWDTGLNTLESGWQILHDLYGDNNPRLFAFWTSDSYQKNSCYNLDCPGFVQVNRDIALGAALNTISTYNGDQFDFLLTIEKEQDTGLWWLKFETYLVGYWPSFIVPKLANSARMIAWGGEIVHSASGGTHTLTQMGSGHFAEAGFKKAAYFNSIAYIDKSNYPITPFLKILKLSLLGLNAITLRLALAEGGELTFSMADLDITLNAYEITLARSLIVLLL